MRNVIHMTNRGRAGEVTRTPPIEEIRSGQPIDASA